MRFLILEGTARNGRKSIHAAEKIQQSLQDNHEAELFDIKNKEIPMLQTRTYADPGQPPEDIQEFSQKVEESDCLILVVPEYNHTYPGAMKNLLDHLYPEYDDLPFAYVTVSGGGFGGVRTQKDLVSLTVTLGGIPGPSLAISKVGERFNEKGELIDEEYQERINQFADKVIEHVQKYSQIG